MFKYILFPLLLSLPLIANAQTKLASLFTEHMVLQQKDEVVIWGKDTAGTTITVSGSWGAQTAAKTDNSGNWRLQLTTPTAGGPFQLKIEGTETIEFNDVLIGEVWLCAGQSNMAMPLKGFNNQPINGSQQAILNGNQNRIRAFNIRVNEASTPTERVSGRWIPSTPEAVRHFSATAYFFAQQLQETLDVPIGIIVSARGGSCAEAWTDAATLDRLDMLPEGVNLAESKEKHTLFYNGMIHPIAGYTIQGAIWYQGESNIRRADRYQELFEAMVHAWREQWGQGNFPFYYVQIAPFYYGPKNESAFLREAQLHAMDTLENAGMAVTLDIGAANYIHPPEKKIIGQRLSYWALAKTYGIKGIEYSGPVYDRMEVLDGGKIALKFKQAPHGISSFGKKLTGFEIAGEDRIFHPAKAKIDSKPGVLAVWSEAVPAPVSVRYCFKNWVEGTLFSTAGLPASSFRTDNWEQ